MRKPRDGRYRPFKFQTADGDKTCRAQILDRPRHARLYEIGYNLSGGWVKCDGYLLFQ